MSITVNKGRSIGLRWREVVICTLKRSLREELIGGRACDRGVRRCPEAREEMTKALLFRKSYVVRVRGRDRGQATSGHSLFWPRRPADSVDIHLAFADKLAIDIVLGSWTESHVAVCVRVISPPRRVLSPFVLFHRLRYLLVHDHDLQVAEMGHVRDREQKVRQLERRRLVSFRVLEDEP